MKFSISYIHAIILFLLSPIFIFGYYLQSISLPKNIEWLEVIFWTFIQSGLSSVLALVLGFLGARGLVSFAHKKYLGLLEALLIIPCLIPPLLPALSIINLTELVTAFPFSLASLIVIQGLIHSGLMAVMFSRLFIKELTSLSEWAWVHGITTWNFLIFSSRSLLKKDIKILFMLLFINAWTSLSLPMLVSGRSIYSLEFYIYEKLKTPLLWPEAGFLMLFQTLGIFTFLWWGFSHLKTSQIKIQARRIRLISQPLMLMIPFICLFLSVSGLFLWPKQLAITQFIELKSILIQASITSLFIGFGVSLLTFALLGSILFSFSYKKSRLFLASYMHPGSMLPAMALLLIFPNQFLFFKWILGLTLLFFPFIYRFFCQIHLDKLETQIQIARVHGATPYQIVSKILWPQCFSHLFLGAGMAGFFSVGDFAFSSLISYNKWSIALVVFDLFSGYHLDVSLISAVLLLMIGLLILLFWQGVAFVYNKKFIL